MKTRQCVLCQSEYTGVGRGRPSPYCLACRNSRNSTNLAVRNSTRRQAYQTAAKARSETLTERMCAHCGVRMKAAYPNALYCSHQCRDTVARVRSSRVGKDLRAANAPERLAVAQARTESYNKEMEEAFAAAISAASAGRGGGAIQPEVFVGRGGYSRVRIRFHDGNKKRQFECSTTDEAVALLAPLNAARLDAREQYRRTRLEATTAKAQIKAEHRRLTAEAERVAAEVRILKVCRHCKAAFVPSVDDATGRRSSASTCSLECSELWSKRARDLDAAKMETPGLTYFIQGVDGGPFKIGQSRDPLRRLKAAQLTSAAMMRIVATTPTAGDEHRLHALFAGSRLHREWFEPTPALLEWIAKYATPFTGELPVAVKRLITCCIPGCGSGDVSPNQISTKAAGERLCRKHGAEWCLAGVSRPQRVVAVPTPAAPKVRRTRRRATRPTEPAPSSTQQPSQLRLLSI